MSVVDVSPFCVHCKTRKTITKDKLVDKTTIHQNHHQTFLCRWAPCTTRTTMTTTGTAWQGRASSSSSSRGTGSRYTTTGKLLQNSTIPTFSVLQKIGVVVWLLVCHAGLEIRAFGQNSQLFQFYTKHSFEHLESKKFSHEFVWFDIFFFFISWVKTLMINDNRLWRRH